MADMEPKAELDTSWMPHYRWEGFHAYGNGDGTFHILVVEGDGGRIVADGISDRAEAEWMADANSRPAAGAAERRMKAEEGNTHRPC